MKKLILIILILALPSLCFGQFQSQLDSATIAVWNFAANLNDFDDQTAWRIFYSNTDGDVTELALGASGTYLKSDGASSAPTWVTPGGAGDITDVWGCATGDCQTITIGESEGLTGGAVDGTTDPYISLPQGNDVSSVTSEGYISWDDDNDKLYVGDGAAVVLINAAGADSADKFTHDGIKDYHIDWGVGAGQVSGADLPDQDMGEINISSATWYVDADVIDASNLADENWGDIAISGGVAEINTDKVGTNELDDGASTPTDEDVVVYEATSTEFKYSTLNEIITGQSWTGNAAIVTVGTIASGTWEGTTVAEAQGGTGDTDLDDIIGGTNCTVTDGANAVIAGNVTIDVDDAFLANDGDAGTGAYDFGGASGFEIPAVDDPTTDAEGEIAWDANDDAIEVYMGDEGESALIPVYQWVAAIIIAPDGVNDEVLMFHVDALLYPFGIEIDQVSITLPADAEYTMVFEEWAGDPPTAQNDISTVTTAADEAYAEEAPDNDAAIDADDYIFLDIPATDVDWIHVQVIFHVNDGN